MNLTIKCKPKLNTYKLSEIGYYCFFQYHTNLYMRVEDDRVVSISNAHMSNLPSDTIVYAVKNINIEYDLED